ncbi:MAG: SBBP repeat-containing protein [Terriglobia bacterium]
MQTQARITQSFATLPMAFEPNRGQTDPQVRYLARGSNYALFLTGDEAVLALRETGFNRQASTNRDSKLKNGKSSLEKRDSKIVDHQSTPDNSTGVIRFKLIGANASVPVTAVDELAGRTNYFIGNDPAQWRANVPTFAKVKYQGVYPGIDLVYYGNHQQLEYDIVVAPGADPHAIRFSVLASGPKLEAQYSKNRNASPLAATPSSRLRIDANGDLVVKMGNGDFRLHKPLVYQEKLSAASRQLNLEGATPERIAVGGRYILAADGTVRFEIPSYDKSRELTIDPVLTYSTYLGGNKDDTANSIAVDSSGNAYIAGQTLSANFPTSLAVFQTSCNGCASNRTNAFVTKFNASGSALVYSTFLGGTNQDTASAIAIDSAGNAYVTGQALSTDFPTVNPFQASCTSCLFGVPDAFVTKLNPSGSALVYSTYLGGSADDHAAGIAVDSGGSAYVTGTTSSTDFPTSTPYQATCNGCASLFTDAFVTKFDPTGATLVYSTFLGGSRSEDGLAVAVDAAGDAFIAGQTQSNNFPVASAYQALFAGIQDCFVTELNPNGTGLTYSTYIGGTSVDACQGIALDSAGNAYLTGITRSTDFPTLTPFQNKLGGSQNAFVLKLDHTPGTLDFSTYLGGNNTDNANAISVDSSGNVYVTGSTTSSNFPAINAIQATYVGNQDAFVTKIDNIGAAIIFSTYLGGHENDSARGIAVDTSSNVYVAGGTFSNDFPTANPYQASTGGGVDAFVTKLGGLALPIVTLSSASLTFSSQLVGTTSSPQSITLTNNGDATLTIASIAATGDFAETDTCVGNVAPGANCSLTVTFTPTVLGTRTGQITVTDNAFGSPRTINLTGTGTAPAVSLSPGSLNFGNQGVGIASSAQTITLTNAGNATLNITSISVSAGFAETNTCGSSVAASANCTISVTFTPTAPGGDNGTLVITDNASNSPQSVSVAGNGVVPFTISATPTSQTVNKGTDTSTFVISASSTFQFTSAIVLSCQNNSPSICTFAPASITAGQTSTLTLSNLTALGSDTLNFSVVGTSAGQTATQLITVLIPDFNLIPSPNTATVNAGQPASYTLSIVPVNGFNQALTLTCSSPPPNSTCTINPNSVTPSGTVTTTVAVTITTTARTLTGPMSGPNAAPPTLFHLPGLQGLRWVFVFFMLAALVAAKRRARLGLAMTVFCVLMWGACLSNNNPTGTPAGNFVINLNASTTGTLQHTTSVGLKVN